MNAFSYSQYTPILPFPSSSLGKKQRQTNVQIEISLHQWGDVACTQWAEGFFFSWLFSSSSKMIPQDANVFHKMLPLAPHFYPIRCNQICLLCTYIGKPKGGGPPSSNKNFHFGCLQKSICFVWWANQNDSLHLKKEKTVELGSTPNWLIETWMHMCYIGVFGMICTHGFQIAMCIFLAIPFRIIHFQQTHDPLSAYPCT